MPTGAPEISLGQKYLTRTTSFDPSYNTLDQQRDLKKLTGANIYMAYNISKLDICQDIIALHIRWEVR